MGFRTYYFLVMVIFLLVIEEAQGKPRIFDVLKYGAIANGKTDNSMAFLKAWNEACEWRGHSRVLIPTGSYKLESVTFKGPCKASIHFVIKGTLIATDEPSRFFVDTWIRFLYIDQLTVSGGGVLDGQGAAAWPYNKCRNNKPCATLPTTIRFYFVTNSWVHHLRSINAKNNHFVLFGCSNMNISKVRISAPVDSPNTDGIKMGSSSNINIFDTKIGTGDDCIAILSGSQKIHISRVTCGPGHGISVGSLGMSGHEDDVMGLTVQNCTFVNTTNGVRIKTWASPWTGQAYDFIYKDIYMINVQDPIQIDQQYCPYPPCNQKIPSQVQISNVTFNTIWGTSNSEVGISLKCSPSKPCQNVVLENIDLKGYGFGGRLSTLCDHVNVFSSGKQNPPACLGW